MACSRWGDASTGPRTKDGLARLTEAITKHGRFTKEKRAEAKRRAGAQVRAELKEIEQWAVDQGHLDKNWRDQLKAVNIPPPPKLAVVAPAE